MVKKKMNKNNLKLAVSIPEAFAATPPDEALPSGDPRYVDLSSCRGGENIVDDLARQIIWTPEGFLKLLLTGHRGCGKTTELYRLKSRLEEAGYFVLYWNAELELNLMNVEWVDVILTHTRQLAEQIPKIDPDIKIEERFLDSIADWLAKEIVKKVERKEMEAELESKFKIGVEIPFFLKALLGLKAYIRGGTEEVREIRHELERRALTLLNDVNLFIDDLQRQLRRKGYKGLIILVDGLEKLILRPLVEGEGERSLTSHNLLFIEQSEFLKSPSCHIVYTVPISLLAEENIAQVFPDDPVVIPMVEVYNKPLEENQPLKKNQQGIDLLCEVVRRRIDVEKVFKDENILKKLCVESGGHIRDFLRLSRYACRYSKGDVIDEKAVNRAISALSTEYDYLVKDADIEKLVKVEREKRLPSDMEYAHLPYHLLVLEYRSSEGEKWALVNPLVKRLPKFKEAFYGK
jgi:hypothetical protein